jgi:hopanoid biosynthesis associated protein HpnK
VIIIKKLIINADDFGLHKSINDGIIKAYQDGCVTSATIVAGGNAFVHAAMLAQHYPGLKIGVHLTLVGLRPLAREGVGSLLTNEGNFFPDYLTFTHQYICGRIKPEDIEIELRCQLQKVVESGIPISHLDSHQHLHVLPGFPRIVGKLAREFNITKIRIPAEPVFFFKTGFRSSKRVLARTILTGCAHQARHYYQLRGFRSPDHFFGMLSGGQTDQQNLLAIINHLPEGISEIMVHPGASNEVINREYLWNYWWEQELAALQSTETLSRIKERQIELINYYGL